MFIFCAKIGIVPAFKSNLRKTQVFSHSVGSVSLQKIRLHMECNFTTFVRQTKTSANIRDAH